MEAGAVTALMGQGLGPLLDVRLRRRAAAVLPHVDCIALREDLASLSLCADLGVPPERVHVTGDDAVERAFNARPPRLGSAIGLNVRAAGYAGADAGRFDRIGRVVRDLAQAFTARVDAVPTSSNSGEDDSAVLQRITGETIPAGSIAETFERIAECRVMVAGSYHAAVIALSMGIPAVTIALSEYYADKFRGLAGQFGGACRVITAGDDLESALREAIVAAWTSADDSRETLLTRARLQAARGREVWNQMFALVEKWRAERNRA
jgi:polysaccharide pyruvyl transferase WcaK-like protein